MSRRNEVSENTESGNVFGKIGHNRDADHQLLLLSLFRGNKLISEFITYDKLIDEVEKERRRRDERLYMN